MSEVTIAQVAVKKSSGGYNLLNLKQYMALALDQRMQMIRERKVQFLDHSGEVIPVVKALNSLVK